MSRKTRLERRIEQLTLQLRTADRETSRFLAACALCDIALGSAGTRVPEAAMALADYLSDPNELLRCRAAEALARFGTTDALSALEAASGEKNGDWAAYYLRLARRGLMDY